LIRIRTKTLRYLPSVRPQFRSSVWWSYTTSSDGWGRGGTPRTRPNSLGHTAVSYTQFRSSVEQMDISGTRKGT